MASLVLFLEALLIRRWCGDGYIIDHLTLTEGGAKKETNKNAKCELGKQGTAVDDDKPQYDAWGLVKETCKVAEICRWP
ncbi:hypothetical protein SLE2022_331280 [Rubroshorea leprosula]